MKLHDLRPAEGSRKLRTRVGRGIAAGKGKTAGRGTKGQKSRAGGSIPAWFEGGQTPLHMRIPKLRGFKRRGRIEYEIVNVGDIGRLVEAGAFAADETAGKAAPPTVNQDTLREVGLVRTLARPLKVLGQGELAAALFVVADAFSKSAVAKIEAAGGSVTVLERPTGPLQALGVTATEEVPATEAPPAEATPVEAAAVDAPVADAPPAEDGPTREVAEATESAPRKRSTSRTPKPRAARAGKAAAAGEPGTTTPETAGDVPADANPADLTDRGEA